MGEGWIFLMPNQKLLNLKTSKYENDNNNNNVKMNSDGVFE
jgi:hypothetical protein